VATTRDDNTVSTEYKRGLQLARAGEWFAAHEAFELAWRAAGCAERDFFQGLVHAVVFSYQTTRGRTVGAERQRAKAIRRLGPYAPVRRGLDVERLVAALVRAEPDLREHLVDRDPEPPVAVEEEQQAERDEHGS
jgi:predicted metal-dependent hydrolase